MAGLLQIVAVFGSAILFYRMNKEYWGDNYIIASIFDMPAQLFVAGFMVVVFSFTSGEVDNLLMKVCSFVPFTSSMAMFTRIAMSTVPWYEILISIVILIGSVAGVGVVSAKIYRVGVLLYGTTPKIGSILKAVWKA